MHYMREMHQMYSAFHSRQKRLISVSSTGFAVGPCLTQHGHHDNSFDKCCVIIITVLVIIFTIKFSKVFSPFAESTKTAEITTVLIISNSLFTRDKERAFRELIWAMWGCIVGYGQ